MAGETTQFEPFENRTEPQEQYVFTDTHTIEELAELEFGSAVEISGRVLRSRGKKHYTFMDLHDWTGSIQLVSSSDSTPQHEDVKNISNGDCIAVRGTVGETQAGERSVFLNDWKITAKTEVPFPDKWKGITDTDTVYRQRYLDLATNPDAMHRFRTRSRIVSLTRRFMEDQGFMEVETPMLQVVHGGASARPFETHHNALDLDLSLRIAPELYLKRLVVGGMKRVFEIGRVFRNEGISTRHNPEFTMMEAYAAGWDYEDQMKLTEDLVAHLAQEVLGSTQITYRGRSVDLSPPWERRSMDSLVTEKLGLGEDVHIDTKIDRLREICDFAAVEWEEDFGPGKLIEKLYEKVVEADLWGPIFVTDHPVEISPLAREHRSRPGYTERFEGIVAGRELNNAFTELNDPRIQYERFKDQGTDDEAMPMDRDYVRALRYGLPPTAGMGIGIDRLTMLLTNASSIKDVILFPTQRPEQDEIDLPYDSEVK